MTTTEARAADEGIDLRDPGLDGNELGAPLDDEPFVELVAAVHLEREAAKVAQPLLTEEEERASLASELACPGRGRLAVEEGHGVRIRAHPGCTPRVPGYSWITTRRSSVISRTAQAGPSRVLPESLTPP